MALTEQAQNVIERPLPKDKIKQRPGKGGLTFDYVTPDFVINLLNEAFEYRWSTSIVRQDMYGDTAVVGLNLTVWDAEDNPIDKTQYGSCDVSRGMGPGEAFKGAASDAMKKAATLLGVALELYNDDDAPKQQFQKPSTPSSQASGPSPSPLPQPPSPKDTRDGKVPRPPKPMVVPTTSSTVSTLPKPTTATSVSPKPINPFANGVAANVPKSTAPAPTPVLTPASPRPVSVPKTNPFESRNTASSLNSTQVNALTNLSKKKELSQPDMIALGGILDESGNPKQVFEELSHAEAIQVIKASQLSN